MQQFISIILAACLLVPAGAQAGAWRGLRANPDITTSADAAISSSASADGAINANRRPSRAR